MSDELLKRGRKLLAAYERLEMTSPSEDNALSLIRDLLAEVKRFHAIVDTANATIAQFADKAEYVQARLRELASAEPVAYGFPNTAITGGGPPMMMLRHEVPPSDQYAGQFWIPLIRRPEMPS